MRAPTKDELRARGRRLFDAGLRGNSLLAHGLGYVRDVAPTMHGYLVEAMAVMVGEAFMLGYCAAHDERPHVIRD